jgi:hypothetical protein
MVHFKKRIGEDEEEIGLLLKRKRKKEPEVERKLDGNRFPPRSDGSPAWGFATLSHGNIKSMAQLAKAQKHNTRAIDTPNARDEAPEPIELLEEMTGSYADRLKAVFEEHQVPFKMRKGGILATEDLYGASPEYWNRNGDWKQKPIDEIINDPVVRACLALARRKYGNKLISCSLHVDEESPHIHVVAVPLVKRMHATRGPKPKDCPIGPDGKPIDYRPLVEKYSLDASSERGLSRQLELNHDEWAHECKDIGLVRGERGSDMTEEQRRARRNRQTGRASMAEKRSREKREDLERSAEQSRDRAAANEELARKRLDDADAEKAAAEAARQVAEEYKKTQLALESELRELNSQALLKAASTEEDRKKSSKLLKAQELREADHEAALAFVASVLDPESEPSVVLINDQMKLRGRYDAKEALLLRKLPPGLYDAIGGLLRLVANTNQQQDQLELARQQVENDRALLKVDRELYDKASDALLKNIELAINFRTALDCIPAAQRTPHHNAALKAATALTMEDLPPGFMRPGQGYGAARD